MLLSILKTPIEVAKKIVSPPHGMERMRRKDRREEDRRGGWDFVLLTVGKG